MNDALIQTFALTFGFPYTQTRQELPPLEGGRHLHLGALDGFYRHMDGAWHGENPLADYRLEINPIFTMAALCKAAGYLERLGVWLGQKIRTIFADRRLAQRMGGVWRNV